jgi:quercetin dioxygenase-like cupin family protein
MKASLKMLPVTTLVVAAWSVAWLQAQRANGGVIFASPNHAKFSELPDSKDQVSMAPIWGDSNAGAHGTYTNFAPGYDAGMHTHTNDVWIVVIKGAYLYKDDAGEKRVAAGDFRRVPGGHEHWSGGDQKEGALFYEEGSGKFDFTPAK